MIRIDRRALIVSAAAGGLSPAAAARAHTGWHARAPMPWPVQEIYAAVLDGKIVTAGGLKATRGQPLHIEDRVAVYDPAADRWEAGPTLPEARHHPMLIAGDGELYVVGGYGRSEAGEWTNMTDVWVMTDTALIAAAPLPSPQAEAVGARVGDRLHLVTGRTPKAGSANGGWNDQADTDRHLTYVIGDGRWETARPSPSARNSAAGAVLDGALWIAGGRTVSGGGTGRLDRYDPAQDRWDTLAPIPSSPTGQQVGGGLAMAALGGRLVAFGGEWFAPGGGGVFAETWIYDPARDAWARGPDMPTPRHGLAAAAVGEQVYAIAGGDVVSGGNATGVVESFRL